MFPHYICQGCQCLLPDALTIPNPFPDDAAAEERGGQSSVELGQEEYWSHWNGSHCLGQ